MLKQYKESKYNTNLNRCTTIIVLEIEFKILKKWQNLRETYTQITIAVCGFETLGSFNIKNPTAYPNLVKLSLKT